MFNLDRDITSSIAVSIFRDIASSEIKKEELKVLKWLNSLVSLCDEDYTTLFEIAAKNGNLKVLDWLCLTFNLKKKDLNYICRNSKNQETANWAKLK
jgi:hypothetical protein